MVSKHSIFVDANIILDVLLKREHLYEASSDVLGLAEKKEVVLKTSVLSYGVIFYFVKKGLSMPEFLKRMKHLRSIVGVLPNNEGAVDFALNSGFSDLEDAMQNQIAESNGLRTIITRNKRDFRKSNLAILTPEEFLATL